MADVPPPADGGAGKNDSPPPNAPAPTTGSGKTSDPGNGSTSTDPADGSVLKVRAWTGLLVVIFGDVAIALAAILAVVHVTSSGNNGALIVSIASSAFTAIGTMTTAYFGIRSMSNTAQTSINNS
jgi:predicted tellurium resistance membrane protein TerC